MGVRRIVVAEEMGYCWGVRRALDIIQEAGDPANPVATIGDVIHNPQVVERLRSRGVDTSGSIAEASMIPAFAVSPSPSVVYRNPGSSAMVCASHPNTSR